MTGRYAAATGVPTDRSRSEIERTLSRYGADGFAYGWSRQAALIGFEMHDRQVRFVLPLPDRDDPAFTRTPTGKPRTKTAHTAAYEQAVRQRWRALALVIKAKLEAVETGIVTFEQEFAMHMVLPDGSLVGDQVLPAIAHAYETGRVSPLIQIEQGPR